MHHPSSPSSNSNIAGDNTTKTIPPGSPRPQTATQATTTTRSTQPQSPTTFEACSYNYLQSAAPTPRPATPFPSTAVTLHRPRHETTATVDQSTTSVDPISQPQSMHCNWTVEKVTQVDELRSQGLPWSQVSRHFPGKTGNACRKRHERHKQGILRRGSVIERGNERGEMPAPVESTATNSPRVPVHEATATTTLTSSQAQIFASMLAPVNYSNMTPAQILQMHNQFLHDVLEIPLLRFRATAPPSFMLVSSQSTQVVSAPQCKKFTNQLRTYLP